MEKLRSGLEFIFSSYKRTAAILVLASLTLAIPITISLVGQQQDIRQRAEVLDTILSNGPKSPNKVEENTSVGVASWQVAPGSSLVNVFASDNIVAYHGGTTGPMYYLKTNGYRFDIPDDARINGIKVEVEGGNCITCGQTTNKDFSVRLVKGGVIQGEDKARGALFSADSYTSYGGETDLWRLTFSPSDIENPDFGVAVSAQAGPSNPAIDHIRITVYFTPAVPTPTSAKATLIPTSNLSPTPDVICAQVITYARDTLTGECREFPTACLPDGWIADSTCSGSTTCTPVPEGCQVINGTATCVTADQEAAPRIIEGPLGGWCPDRPSPTGQSSCGDGICQNVVCLAIGCPEPESATNCPQDCAPSPTIKLRPTDTLTTPTPTVTSTVTALQIRVQLTGIGATTSAGINNNPKRPSRNVNVIVINAGNQKAASVSGNITFNPATGVYRGPISLPQDLLSGSYLVKIKIGNTLRKLVPGIVNITQGILNAVPLVELISGDINNDNELDIRDYNQFISCYGNKPCTSPASPDLNDDGKVDELDLNILYAGFSKRQGD